MITKEFVPNESFGTGIFGAFLMLLELKFWQEETALIPTFPIIISVLNVYSRALCITLVFQLIHKHLCSFRFRRKQRSGRRFDIHKAYHSTFWWWDSTQSSSQAQEIEPQPWWWTAGIQSGQLGVCVRKPTEHSGRRRIPDISKCRRPQRGEVEPGVQSQDPRVSWGLRGCPAGAGAVGQESSSQRWSIEETRPRHSKSRGNGEGVPCFSPFPLCQSLASTSHWLILTGSWQTSLGNAASWDRARGGLRRYLRANGK